MMNTRVYFMRLVAFLLVAGILLSACEPASTEPPQEPPIRETPTPTPAPYPAPESVKAEPYPCEGSLEEFIQVANQQYAAALETVEPQPLEVSWHGEVLDRWQSKIAELQKAGRYRRSQYQIEVIMIHQPEPDQALVKTIEYWDADELDANTQEIVQDNPRSLYFEIYQVACLDGHWSIGALDIQEEPSLTLTDIQGEVLVNDEPVQGSREIYPGDKIVTALGASALLLYPFDSRTEIFEDSHLVLAGLRIVPEQNQEGPRLRAEFDLYGTDLWNLLKGLVKTLFKGPSGATADDNPSTFGVSLLDDGTLLVSVETGEVLLTSAGVSLKVTSGFQAAAPAGKPPLEPIPFEQQTFRTTAWAFNLESQQVADPRIRKALAVTASKDRAVEIAGDGAIPASTFTPSDILGADLTGRIGYEFDPELARSMLYEANYNWDTPLRVLAPENAAQLVDLSVSNWRQYLDINISTEIVPISEYDDRLREDPGDLFLLTWVSPYNSPDGYLRQLFFTDSPVNFMRYSNPEFETLVKTAADERDPDKQLELYAAAENILIMEDVTVIPMFYTPLTRTLRLPSLVVPVPR